MKTFLFGLTVNRLGIPAFRWEKAASQTKREILILGGVHGNEPEGVVAAHGLLAALDEQFDFCLNLTLVPALNLDGVLANQRLNSKGVDLNRNLPSKDWDPKAHQPKYNPGPHPNSEPENQALVDYLQKIHPTWVLSLHSWNPMLNVNGDCMPEAEEIHRMTSYRIDRHIGYATPGCLGTYCGLENGIPTLTYEIERGQKHSDIIRLHVPAILSAIRIHEGRASP